jgi:hypothetical protein
MERYQILFELLLAGSATVLSLVLWSGLVLLLLLLSGLWLPIVLARATEDRNFVGDGSLEGLASKLPLALAGGLATGVTAWTLSLFLSGGFFLGDLLLCGIALAGVFMAWRQRPEGAWDWREPGPWLVASMFALLLGFWHHAATELPISQDVARLVFSDLQRDLGAHVSMAGLVRDGGLPMQSFWGSADYAYWGLSHTGHIVLVAGFAEGLGVSLYQASTLLWTIATLLIAWAALGILAATRLPVFLRLAIVVGTLVWGAFGWPELHRLYDPLRETAAGGFELDSPGYWVAGRGFWNLPQALSIALTLAGLLVLDAFGPARRSGKTGLALLLGASFLFVCGGWTKPSLFIFYGPALLLWLALNRVGFFEFLWVVLVLGAGVLVYAIPALFFALPESPAWTFLPGLEQWEEVAEFVLRAGLGLAVLAAGVVLARWKGGEPWGEFRVLDLALLAAGGSVLFGLLFREDQFVGSPVFQPNIWWGMAGCMILLVPLLGRDALAQWKRGGGSRWLAGVGLSLGLLHLFNGFCLAVVYPTLNLRGHALSDAEALASARSKTDPGARFAIDPELQDYDLLAYLSRPVLMSSAAASDQDREDLQAWQSFVEGGFPASGEWLGRFDAVVLRQDRRHAAGSLASRQWRREALGHGFELWLAPGPGDSGFGGKAGN